MKSIDFSLNIKPITLIAGHFGSGKTEVAINLAFASARAGFSTRLLDLDIVNPYFRSFEAKEDLEAAGIDLVVSSLGGYADMPAVPSEVASIFINNDVREIVDLGGDPDGVRLLGMYENQLKQADFDFFFIYNANRPETADRESGLRYFKNIELLAKQKFTAVINNTHMMAETCPSDVLHGQTEALALADTVGLPLLCNVMTREVYKMFQADHALMETLERPCLIVDLMMKKPWEKI